MEKDELLFGEELKTFSDWSRVFCSKEVFEPLVRGIFLKEGLPYHGITTMEPGTNAVFRTGDMVIKVYVPEVCSDAGTDGGAFERYAMRMASKAGIRTPVIRAEGIMHDRYDFSYMIMDHVPGRMLRDCIRDLDEVRKGEIVSDLWEVVLRLREIPMKDGMAYPWLPHRSRKWDMFTEGFRRQISEIQDSYSQECPCVIHGDLTGENILLNGKELTIIDFGDVHYGPWYYELPSLFIEGLGCDDLLCSMMKERADDPDIYDHLIKGIAIHEFGPELVTSFCRRKGIAAGELKDVRKLADIMKGCWN